VSTNGRPPRAKDALFAVESWLGGRVTDGIRAHHRRRLQRLGRLGALEPPAGGWADGDPPPRRGNSVELLVDGASALPAIAEELQRATSHVHIAGWYFTPDFALRRDEDPLVLRNLLAELAERVDVRVLSWAGAPLPLFRPSRREVRRMRERLVRGTRIRCELDAKERPMHCHHEKTVVVDDHVAFVGGIDLTDEAGDRFDTRHHQPRAAVGWHDAAMRIEGPAVADVAEHFRMRWEEVAGEQLPPVEKPSPAGEVELQVVRTVPERIYRPLRRGDFRILESYMRALLAADRLVYLENQFLWSPEIAGVLVDKIENPPTPDFRLLLVLPAKANSGNDDTRGVLADLIDADADAGRVLACTLYARSGSLQEPVYVHAKIGIVDDEWLTLGSANLNEHSLFNDTEMNVVVRDPGLATRTRLTLWSEHLELPVDRIPADPVEAIEELWKPISKEQLCRRQAGEPLTHRLVRLPHVSRRTSRALGPISGLFVDG
jgi:phosphatidylserine/phosphatidylglycerophosphate/cardiolipin synthase-like enzyme